MVVLSSILPSCLTLLGLAERVFLTVFGAAPPLENVTTIFFFFFFFFRLWGPWCQCIQIIGRLDLPMQPHFLAAFSGL
jgi:hypothetical protein